MVTVLRWFKEYSIKDSQNSLLFMIFGKNPRQPVVFTINQIKGKRIYKTKAAVHCIYKQPV